MGTSALNFIVNGKGVSLILAMLTSNQNGNIRNRPKHGKKGKISCKQTI
jgi:hypothetical protein